MLNNFQTRLNICAPVSISGGGDITRFCKQKLKTLLYNTFRFCRAEAEGFFVF